MEEVCHRGRDWGRACGFKASHHGQFAFSKPCAYNSRCELSAFAAATKHYSTIMDSNSLEPKAAINSFSYTSPRHWCFIVAVDQ